MPSKKKALIFVVIFLSFPMVFIAYSAIRYKEIGKKAFPAKTEKTTEQKVDVKKVLLFPVKLFFD